MRSGARGYLLKGALKSEKTIRNNVSNILNKLQVIDRAQAVVKARDAGLI